MLSLFPELFDWGFFVPFFFRIVLGAYITLNGYRFFKSGMGRADKKEIFASQILGLCIMVVGVFLVIGLFTQVAATVAGALGILLLFLRLNNSPIATQTRAFYVLATIVLFSLLFLGPGAFAIDLPL